MTKPFCVEEEMVQNNQNKKVQKSEVPLKMSKERGKKLMKSKAEYITGYKNSKEKYLKYLGNREKKDPNRSQIEETRGTQQKEEMKGGRMKSRGKEGNRTKKIIRGETVDK